MVQSTRTGNKTLITTEFQDIRTGTAAKLIFPAWQALA